MLTETFDEDNPPAYVAANERLYKALGLMPAGRRPDATCTLDLLSSQVAGLYDPTRRSSTSSRRSGGVGADEQITFAHEYDHALQDQHFDVFKPTRTALDDQSDRVARPPGASSRATRRCS